VGLHPQRQVKRHPGDADVLLVNMQPAALAECRAQTQGAIQPHCQKTIVAILLQGDIPALNLQHQIAIIEMVKTQPAVPALIDAQAAHEDRRQVLPVGRLQAGRKLPPEVPGQFLRGGLPVKPLLAGRCRVRLGVIMDGMPVVPDGDQRLLGADQLHRRHRLG